MIEINGFNCQSKLPAVLYEGITYSYQDFYQLILARKEEITHQISSWSELVLIDETDPFDHWISTLAASSLGLTTAPCVNDASCLAEIKSAYIMASTPQQGATNANEIKVTSFRHQPLNGSPTMTPTPALFSGARVFFTSGTTGQPKAMSLSAQLMLGRLHARLAIYPKLGDLLCLMPHLSTFGYQFQLAQWLGGGLVLLDRDYSYIFHSLLGRKIDYLVGSPYQYIALLNQVKSFGRTQFKATIREIIVGGGALSVQLWQDIKALLGENITCQFGATETGTWSINTVNHASDLSSLGRAAPGVEFGIEEVQNKKMLRIKSPHMNLVYQGDDSAHHKATEKEWFYSGDVVDTDAAGTIQLTGRNNEIVNVGGVKVNPQIIDEFMMQLAGVKDAACFWMKDTNGYPELWAAAVIKNNANTHSIYTEIFNHFGVALAPKRLISVAFIPRAYSGKPQRRLMTEKVIIMLNSSNATEHSD